MLEKATTKAESASALDRRRHGPSQGAQGGAQVVADREKLEAEAAAQIQTIQGVAGGQWSCGRPA